MRIQQVFKAALISIVGFFQRRVLLLVTLPLLAGCSQNWGWYVVNPATKSGLNNLLFLIDGLYFTVALSLTAILISITVGLIIALPGLAKSRATRSINRVYVELVRAVPILVLILWVYYGLPQIADISISVFWAGVLALAISDSAFQAEIFRAGIQSIDRGQHEAAHSISLNYWDKMRFVILPQAIKRILPALGNQLVYMLKMSSLVSVIGMQELTRRANELVVTEYRPLEIYTILVIEYLVLILLVSAAVRALEKRLSASDDR
ncbi:amino acid ABC transporter permease [Alphaproteobacteria bacterium]|nr:amino acid ABC transporter permease [Alphaproteobacteria bacterium]